jgi:hypothetical protein
VLELHHYNDHIPLSVILTFLKTKLDILNQQGRLSASQNTSICPKCDNYWAKLCQGDYSLGTSSLSKSLREDLVNCLTDLCSTKLSNVLSNIIHFRKLTILQNASKSGWRVSKRNKWLILLMINSSCWLGFRPIFLLPEKTLHSS